VKDTFVLDACALIAILNDEDGADKVDYVIQKAESRKCLIYMNKLNLLEVYYIIYRKAGINRAEEILFDLLSMPLIVIDKLEDDIFKEAGRLKTKYKISLADSIALAETKVREAQLMTSDHHEFDPIDKDGEINFYWIR
jgi:PIN domain nuclease of toxin-antitoxin system